MINKIYNKFESNLINIRIKYIDLISIVISLFVSFIISKKYYENNILSKIDSYKEFILGDTIFSSYSKDTDFIVIVMFILIFFLIYLCMNILNKKILKNDDCIEFTINEKILNKEIYINIYNNILILFLSYYASNVFIKLISILNNNLNNNKINLILTLLIYLVSIKLKNKQGILIPQLFLPLVYISLCTKNTLIVDGVSHILLFNNSLKIFSIVVIMISYLFIYKSIKNKEKISFSTIMFFIFILNVTINPDTFMYPIDEYHNGEIITNYQQIFNFGQSMYHEYVPVKGIMHTLIGLINKVFFDGNYIYLSISIMLTSFIFISIVAFFVQKYIGRTYLLGIILLGLLQYNEYLLIPVFLVILSDKKNYNNPYNFIINYCYMCFIYIFFYQSFGIAFSVSVFPIVIIKLIEIIKNKYKPTKNQIIALVLGFILLIITSYTFIGIIEYSLVNAGNNKLYWGNSSGFDSYLNSGQVSEFWKHYIKSSLWILPWLLCIIYTLKNYKTIKSKYVFISFYLIFPIIIFSYMYGRHDWVLNRVNRYTVISMYLLLLYSIYYLYNNNKYKYSILFILLFSHIMGYPYKPSIEKLNLVNRISFIHEYNYSNEYTYVENTNVPNIKNGIIPTELYESIEKEFLLFDTILNKDETFLIIDDYVTQSARYYLYDKKIPTLSHSVLNMTSILSQTKELDKVKQSDVKIVRYTPAGIKRYYMFYDYYINKLISGEFIQVSYNGYNYLIDKNKFNEYKQVLNLKESEYDNNQISTNEFGYLPIKWGSNFKNTKEKLIKHNYKYDIVSTNGIELKNNEFTILDNSDPFILYKVNENLNGDDIDYIRYVFKSNNKKLRSSIYWKTDEVDFNEEHKVSYIQLNGNNIIPIGMNLNWKKEKNISYIRIDFDEVNIGDNIKIDSIEFLQQESLYNEKIK